MCCTDPLVAFDLSQIKSDHDPVPYAVESDKEASCILFVKQEILREDGSTDGWPIVLEFDRSDLKVASVENLKYWFTECLGLLKVKKK